MITTLRATLPHDQDHVAASYVAGILHEHNPSGHLSHGDEHGRESSTWPEDGARRIGILYRDPSRKPTKHLFGLVTREPEPILLGMLNFRDSPRNPSERGWLFEICSDHHHQGFAREVIAMLRLESGVDITIIDEEPAVRDARLYDQMYD